VLRLDTHRSALCRIVVIQALGAIARVASGAKNATTIVSNLPNSELVIYDGKTASNPGTQAP
jgi:hypothetical protein